MMTQKRLSALNIERQKQIVADTTKLLRLARELNEEVAASNTGRLTPAELHKVAEIENQPSPLLELIFPLIDGYRILAFRAERPGNAAVAGSGPDRLGKRLHLIDC